MDGGHLAAQHPEQGEIDVAVQDRGSAVVVLRDDAPTVSTGLTSTDGRRCWWCGSDQRLTLEHVVPFWIGEVLEGTGRAEHSYVEPGAETPERTWSNVRPDFKARVACKRCNNGWMSEIETAAKPRIVRLLDGRTQAISRADCAVLARWATKTALMFQALEPHENRVVEAARYAEVRTAAEQGSLPPTVRVWAGSVVAGGVWSRAFGGELRPRSAVPPCATSPRC
jgi:hypothetical protein